MVGYNTFEVIIIKKLCMLLAFVLVFYFTLPTNAENQEVILLASAVEAVTGGESYTVMLAVSSVFLNRLCDEAYPSSLAAIISDAGIDLSAVEVSQRAIHAARDALGGFDPTGGALHYSHDAKELSEILLGIDSWSFY
jgi:spore germination cell wall hydrolase CwlJ-like protein